MIKVNLQLFADDNPYSNPSNSYIDPERSTTQDDTGMDSNAVYNYLTSPTPSDNNSMPNVQQNYYNSQNQFGRNPYAAPTGYIPVRDTMEGQGINVGYDTQNGVTFNGNAVDTSKWFLGADNRYYAHPNDLGQYTGYDNDYENSQAQKATDAILNPPQTPPLPEHGAGTPAQPQQTQQLSLFQYGSQLGAKFGLDPLGRLVVNGIGVDPRLFGLQNVDGQWTGTKEQIDKFLSMVPGNKSAMARDEAFGRYQGAVAQPFNPVNQNKALSIAEAARNKTFQYDYNNDPVFKATVDYGTNKVIEEMNRRGIANSSMTKENVMRMVADKLLSFQQNAFNQFNTDIGNQMRAADIYQRANQSDLETYQQRINNIYNEANFLNGLSTQEVTQYRQAITDKQNQDMIDFNKKQKEIENKRKEIEDAWTRVENLGYADNQAAQVLGVPTGTPIEGGTSSKDVRQVKLKLLADLDMEKARLQADIAKTQEAYKGQMAVLDHKQKLENDPTSIGYKEAQANIYNKYNAGQGKESTQEKTNKLDAFSKVVAQINSLLKSKTKSLGDIIKDVAEGKDAYIQAIGAENYNKLITLLESMDKRDKEKADKDKEKAYEDAKARFSEKNITLDMAMKELTNPQYAYQTVLGSHYYNKLRTEIQTAIDSGGKLSSSYKPTETEKLLEQNKR